MDKFAVHPELNKVAQSVVSVTKIKLLITCLGQQVEEDCLHSKLQSCSVIIRSASINKGLMLLVDILPTPYKAEGTGTVMIVLIVASDPLFLMSIYTLFDLQD
jgi:hypothetical protein